MTDSMARAQAVYDADNGDDCLCPTCMDADGISWPLVASHSCDVCGVDVCEYHFVTRHEGCE